MASLHFCSSRTDIEKKGSAKGHKALVENMGYNASSLKRSYERGMLWHWNIIHYKDATFLISGLSFNGCKGGLNTKACRDLHTVTRKVQQRVQWNSVRSKVEGATQNNNN